MRRRTSLAIATLIGALLGPSMSAALAATTSAGPPRPITWLAAGDSYSSGQGLTYESGQCARADASSTRQGAWGVAAARRLATSPNPALSLQPGSPNLQACSGGKTGEFFDPQQSNPAEWRDGDPKYDIVSFTFGGDDVDFPRVIKTCLGLDSQGLISGVALGSSATDPVTAVAALGAWQADPLIHCPPDRILRDAIAAEATTYKSFLEKVATRSVTRGGNVVVLGYPEMVEDPDLWPKIDNLVGLCQGIRPADARELRGLAGDLNATIAQDVKAVNAEHINDVGLTYIDVNTGDPTLGISYGDQNLFEPNTGARHNLCAAKEWMNGITLPIAARSFHPNQPGNDGMAGLVQEVFPHLNWTHLEVVRRATVVDCPNSPGSSNPAVPIPPGTTIPLPAGVTLPPTSAVYGVQFQAGVPNHPGYYTVGPVGATCSAGMGGDGGGHMTVSGGGTDQSVDVVWSAGGADLSTGYGCSYFPAIVALVATAGFQPCDPVPNTVTVGAIPTGEANGFAAVVYVPPGVDSGSASASLAGVGVSTLSTFEVITSAEFTEPGFTPQSNGQSISCHPTTLPAGTCLAALQLFLVGQYDSDVGRHMSDAAREAAANALNAFEAATPTATSPIPTLGQLTGLFAQGTGFGQIKPAEFSSGGDPTGSVTNIVWSSWGGTRAVGTGSNDYVDYALGQDVAHGTMESATVVAFNLGVCDGKLMYQAVEWYFPQHGGSFNANSYEDICKGAFVNP